MSSNIVFFCCLFLLLTQTYAQQPDPLASEQQQQGIEGDDVADDETAEVQEDDGGDVVVDKKYRGKYVVVTRNENWWGAKDSCRNMGADLVVIDNEDEQYRVASLLPGKHDRRWNDVCRRHWHYPEMSFWTAGQRENHGNARSGFVWKTNSGNRHMHYSRWQNGEPNNWGGLEACMQLSRNYGYNWNDAQCTAGFCFICEFP